MIDVDIPYNYLHDVYFLDEDQEGEEEKDVDN